MPESRVVLITGASSGFGRETARLLLSRGFKVYGTRRNPSAKPQESGVGMLALDVDSDDSVKNGVKELLDEGAARNRLLRPGQNDESRSPDNEEAGCRPDRQHILAGRCVAGSVRGVLCGCEGRSAGMV